MEYDLEKKEIILDRELSNLDKLVLEFIGILEKYTEYVIISGYVSILLGRTRTTEDVDIFIKNLSKETFSEFYRELDNKGFWCLNAESTEEVYSYLTDGLAVRFSRKNVSIPNFEVKFPKTKLEKETFNDFLEVKLSKGTLMISCLERHIAFKRHFLKSDKDIEDALHIEETFKSKLDYGKINNIKQEIEEEEK